STPPPTIRTLPPSQFLVRRPMLAGNSLNDVQAQLLSPGALPLRRVASPARPNWNPERRTHFRSTPVLYLLPTFQIGRAAFRTPDNWGLYSRSTIPRRKRSIVVESVTLHGLFAAMPAAVATGG